MRHVAHCLLRLLPMLAAVSPAAAWPIDIPLRTWVAVPAARSLAEGACPNGSCKHVRITFNKDDGRTYWLGGDQTHSGNTELFSYDVATNNWRLETPACLPPGELQPSGPDEVGWSYDTKRGLFWMAPGFQWPETCASTMLRGYLMAYDPATKRWTSYSQPPMVNFFTQYDSVTDRLIGFTRSTHLYDMVTGGWTTESFPYPDNINLDKMYTAFDEVGRCIYLVEPRLAKIYKYHIDTHQFVELGPAPTGSHYESYPFWDSVNRVVLWNLLAEGDAEQLAHLHIYHPDTNSWEQDPMFQPEGIPVKGRNGVYDPVNNVLMITGTNAATVPYIFLYRYGNGPGGAPGDSIPPSPPANLRTR